MLTEEEKRERKRACGKAYRAANKEKIKARHRKRYLANREAAIEVSKAYYQANKKKCNNRSLNRYYESKWNVSEEEKEKRQARQRAYWAKNRAKKSEQRKRNREKNGELFRKKKRDRAMKGRLEVSGWYAAMLLARQLSIKIVDIPIELIKLKREQLKLHRLIKEQ